MLVFSPHPDDDVIGCGGSILKHVKKGNVVSVVHITSGDSGSLIYSPGQTISIREDEADKAAKFLGISEVHFFRNADGNLSYTWENLSRIISLLRSLRPDVVYLPHKQDSHRDHRITHELVSESCLRAGSPEAQECGQQLWSVGVILCYEVGTPLPEVNYVEDISEWMEAKVEAMRLHKSQLANLAYDEAVRHLNRLRGITTGRGAYCECFQVLKVSELF
ncbi:MAG TPA: PIG-L family deacetylase [Methylomusa anaerophila]|uniref:PIG-L deacetylase family protein n=1 Tax=Methylomusa anaerophila TaxID=1930071 RepID=UPI001E2DAC9A|nr:PIG-L family deacetylase [Methylomusa anaerophila]HML90395.1 PIG-L family deacetylase [Methylomusa anaerophila]